MRHSKSAAVFFLLGGLVLSAVLAGCTPEYTRERGDALAARAGLLDAIDIRRQNHRVLARQAHVCLASAHGGEDAGASLLRAMQAGFTGYFLAVSVAGESVDYLRAISTPVCPGAVYLFYVQGACGDDSSCSNGAAQFVITIVNAGDQSLVDRLELSIRKSFLPLAADERARQQKAFEQLAIVLTGS